MALTTPPNKEPISDRDGTPPIPWQSFFDQLYNGDGGNTWIPTFVNLTTTGSPIFIGRYFYINRSLVVLNVKLDPNGGTISATSDSTYISNLPVNVRANGACVSVKDGMTGLGLGGVKESNNRVYPAGWASTSDIVNIMGLIEVGR